MIRLTDLNGETVIVNPNHIVTIREANSTYPEAKVTILLDTGTSIVAQESISEVYAWLS